MSCLCATHSTLKAAVALSLSTSQFSVVLVDSIWGGIFCPNCEDQSLFYWSESGVETNAFRPASRGCNYIEGFSCRACIDCYYKHICLCVNACWDRLISIESLCWFVISRHLTTVFGVTKRLVTVYNCHRVYHYWCLLFPHLILFILSPFFIGVYGGFL